jgi:hypothetical protein
MELSDVFDPTVSFVPLILALAIGSLVLLALFALYDHFYGPLSKLPDRDALSEIGRILSGFGFRNREQGYEEKTATTGDRIRQKPFDHEYD